MTEILNVYAYRSLVTLLAVVFLVTTTGCSLVASSTQNVSVMSQPDGAKVYINGAYAGVTPVQYSIPRGEDSMISVSKKGYEPMNRMTSRSLSVVGIVDVVGGVIWLVPFFGLLSGGAWKQTPSHISVHLPEKD